jgi:hypothetical protein
MDLGKMAEDELGQVLSGNTKKKTKTSKSSSTDSAVDSIVDNVDAALKSKLPDGAVADIAEDTLDQNKDGHIVDDLLRMGENLLKKKK